VQRGWLRIRLSFASVFALVSWLASERAARRGPNHEPEVSNLIFESV
jgi:hypothetical protein